MINQMTVEEIWHLCVVGYLRKVYWFKAGFLLKFWEFWLTPGEKKIVR